MSVPVTQDMTQEPLEAVSLELPGLRLCYALTNVNPISQPVDGLPVYGVSFADLALLFPGAEINPNKQVEVLEIYGAGPVLVIVEGIRVYHMRQGYLVYGLIYLDGQDQPHEATYVHSGDYTARFLNRVPVTQPES